MEDRTSCHAFRYTQLLLAMPRSARPRRVSSLNGRDPIKDWTVSSCGRIMYYSMRPQQKIASQTLQIG